MFSSHHLRCILLVPLAIVLALFALAAGRTARACPFCSAPSLTLTETVAQADAVVLVEWTGGKQPEGQQAGHTVYTIREVVKLAAGGAPAAVAGSGSRPGTFAAEGNEQPAAPPQAEPESARPVDSAVTRFVKAPRRNSLEPGDAITLARYRAGKPGELFLLFGTRGTVLEWGSPMEVTETSFKYIVQAPGPDVPPQKRLEYFIKYLEFPDQTVANDAYGEFANAPYSDITTIKAAMPRERIRKWISNPETSVTRLGLYGLLLGLCGQEEDAELMRKLIVEPSDDFRLGIDGIMSGYLLLTGAKGLDVIDSTKLKTQYLLDANGKPVVDDEGRQRKLPFSETYAAMQALRFMWQYAPGTIEPERLRQSMRTLLERPELADLVIADLARWQDWSVQGRLMELYDDDAYNIPSIKRAVVRYMLVCANQKPAEEGGAEPKSAVEAKKHLAVLEKNDPKTVGEARRFFFLQ